METYEVLFKEGETTGVYGISLVNDPAMESMFIALSQKQTIQLKTVDAEKRIVCGAVLIPNKPIYRNQNGKEFNIVFPTETIRLASEAFLRNGHQTSSTLEHNIDAKINNVSIVESWIKLSEVNDKSVMYGFNEPIGTWYASMKIDNPEIWNDYVKTGKVTGFSIDGFFELEKINLNNNNMIKEITQAIKDGFSSLTTPKEKAVDLGTVNTADGTVKVNFEGDTVAVGLAVTMTAPDGSELPVPDGEYDLDGGMHIAVTGGLVSEVSTMEEEKEDQAEEGAAPAAPANPATPMASAPSIKSEKHTQEVFYQLSKEDWSTLGTTIGNLIDSKFQEIETKLSKEKAEVLELTKTKPAKEKSFEEMTSLERFRATKLN